MPDLQFSLLEIISLIGITQSIFLIVYMLLRSGQNSRTFISLLYFFVLGLAFFLDFSRRFISDISPFYDPVSDMIWLLSPVLSVLLAIQIIEISRMPPKKYFAGVFFLVSVYGLFTLSASKSGLCEGGFPCLFYEQGLVIAGSCIGALTMLTFWSKRRSIAETREDSASGKERFWLVMALLAMNSALIFIMMIGVAIENIDASVRMARNFLGLGFLYLAVTSLLRIYPQAVMLKKTQAGIHLNDQEKDLARKIENLMVLDKLYHEPTFSRADLARECECSEAVLSKVINIYFNKSFPQLLNENRVRDAKRLLEQTDEDMQTVAAEVGFNSLATFNRVFKDIEGLSPGAYRQRKLNSNISE